ncbi:uncharacterized protein CTRU02_210446 [Colletotrichum truncatum]|uniref:Uncharacterized protein n=1 Tax=Colletotrichum truncatum TaxID=5467 RepID=A0ACC3YR72_COLTU|nr:uncharacterized protein CTRU02_13953 [Colletotrichum truncatum]KAF6782796.1 hypothetical protein CTRU02_13953 [Colletotrichum truncatum]
MDMSSAQVLSDLPQLLRDYKNDRFKHLAFSMVKTGFHKWGFVVYRCTYDDDDLWNRYLAQLKDNCRYHLEKYRVDKLLEQYLDWVVVENRDTLDNASRPTIRQHFQKWVSSQRAVAWEDEHPGISDLPRFKYCLYVDKKCLDTLEPSQRDVHPRFREAGTPLVVAIIDRQWTPNRRGKDNPMDEGGFPPIDGSDRRYVGWRWQNSIYLSMLYSGLWWCDLDDEISYKRPPAINPVGRESMPE